MLIPFYSNIFYTYLRHRALPLFGNGGSGFDYGLHAEILQEAQYFGFSKLQEWVEEKKYYLQAISVRYSAKELERLPDSSDFNSGTPPHIERTYHPSWRLEDRYRCPRDISLHNGDRSRCGLAYEKAKVDGQLEYENVHLDHRKEDNARPHCT